MQRIRQSVAATLQVVFTDELGVPSARPGGVTVGVTRANGDVVIAPGTAAATAATGVFTKALTALQTAQLDTLTATWRDVTGGVDFITTHRVVGGFMFTIAEARAYDDVLNDSAKLPNAVLAARRDEVEDEAEWICDRSFVPAYDRVTVDGDGTAMLHCGRHDLRRIRAIRLYSAGLDAGYVDLSAAQLSSIGLLPGGVIRRTDGGIFDFGVSNVIVDLEYGLNAPDNTMAVAAIQRLKSRCEMPNSGAVPERSRSWTDPANGTTYEFTGPDAYRTGVDRVDSVYARFSMRKRPLDESGTGGKDEVVPASRTMSYDPQWGSSLFRGGPK